MLAVMRTPTTTEPLEVLSSLVDKGLVSVTDKAGGAARYLMLDPVRRFASDHSRDAGDLTDASQAHAVYYLKLAEQESRRFRHAGRFFIPVVLGTETAPGSLDWSTAMGADGADFESALGWFESTQQSDSFLRLAAALQWYWRMTGQLQAGIDQLGRALAAEKVSDPSVRLSGLRGLAILHSKARQPSDARRAIEAAVDLGRELGDATLLGPSLIELAAIMLALGRLDQAHAAFEETKDCLSQIEDDWTLGVVRKYEALYELFNDHLGRAADLASASVATFQSLDDARSALIAQSVAAAAQLMAGNDSTAVKIVQSCLTEAERVAEPEVSAGILELAAWMAMARHQASQAEQMLGAATTQRAPNVARALPDEFAFKHAIAMAERAMTDDAGTENLEKGAHLTQVEALEMARETIEQPPTTTAEEEIDVGASGPELTSREQEVLQLLAAGRSNKEIASQIFVSEGTAKFHVAAILRKFGVATRTAAVGSALTQGMLSPDVEELSSPVATGHHNS
jgi:non-specific serine/threonine protein kinase